MVSPPARVLSIGFAIATAFVASACFAPSHDADELEPGTQPGSYFGTDGGAPPDQSGACSNPGSSSIRVKVRTTANGGRYAPRNIGAIWIENGAGQFVRTLEVWANTRRRYLTRWKTASAGNTVDAVTGATLSNHTTHDRIWNLDEQERCMFTAGAYKVRVEQTDFNGNGPLLEVPFTMGTPATVTPADQTTFHDILVELH